MGNLNRWVAIVCFAWGCNDGRAAAEGESESEAEGEAEGEGADPCAVDLLFVIDNSGSMAEDQSLLTAEFEEMLDGFESTLGRLPNFHIGVVSSDLGAGSFSLPTCLTPGGDEGCLRATALDTCEAPSPEPYIVFDGESGTGNVEDVAAAFSCIAPLGTSGCGFEQHLESMRQALSPDAACNAGFLRQDSLVAVVVLADEDDCSAEDTDLFDPTSQDIDDPFGPLQSFRCFEFGTTCSEPISRELGVTYEECVPGGDYLYTPESYVSFLSFLRPAGRVLFGAIAGPWEPTDTVSVEPDMQGNPAEASSCDGGLFGTPGIRLRAVADGLGDDGIYTADLGTSICSDDYSSILQLIGDTISGRLVGCE